MTPGSTLLLPLLLVHYLACGPECPPPPYPAFAEYRVADTTWPELQGGLVIADPDGMTLIWTDAYGSHEARYVIADIDFEW